MPLAVTPNHRWYTLKYICFTSMYIYIHSYTCIYIDIELHTCIYIYIYIYLHIHIYKGSCAGSCAHWSKFSQRKRQWLKITMIYVFMHCYNFYIFYSMFLIQFLFELDEIPHWSIPILPKHVSYSYPKLISIAPPQLRDAGRRIAANSDSFHIVFT